jgi:hypothetical protein
LAAGEELGFCKRSIITMDLMKRAYKLSQKLLVKKTLNNSKSNLKNQLISASS